MRGRGAAARRSGGFTLMEMMIALVVGAVMIAPLYIVTRGMSQQTEGQKMESEAVQRSRNGLSMLIQDISRAGLMVSVSSQVDVDSLNKEMVGSTAEYRRAIIHLNTKSSGSDALLLGGNFLGGNFYAATLNGNLLTLSDVEGETCARQFDARYAFAHIRNGKDKHLDARVESVDSGGKCELTLATTDFDERFMKDGEQVFVAANQTVLYWVEPVVDEKSDRKDLVRYFVDYDGSSAPSTSDCQVGSAAKVSDIALPGDSAVIEATRRVVAEYVEDFQVWFRPVRKETSPSGGSWYPPSYIGPALTDLAGGFVPDDSDQILVADPSSYERDVACEDVGAYTFGAENVRSVLIRLAVRSERADSSIDYRAFENSGNPSRLVRYTLHPYEADDDTESGPLTERRYSAYRLKTLLTEVDLMNLATRLEILESQI